MPPNPDSERIALATLAEGGISASTESTEWIARNAREKMQSGRPDAALALLAAPRPKEAAAAINKAKDKLKISIEDVSVQEVIESQSALMAELVEKGFRGMGVTERNVVVGQLRDFLKDDAGMMGLFPDGCPEMLRYGNDRERFSLDLASRLLQNPVFVDFVEAQINTELGKSVDHSAKHKLDKERTDLDAEKSEKEENKTKLEDRIKEIADLLKDDESEMKSAKEKKATSEIMKARLSDVVVQIKAFSDLLTSGKTPPDLVLNNPFYPKKRLTISAGNVSNKLFEYQGFLQHVELSLAQATAEVNSLTSVHQSLLEEKARKETEVQAIDARLKEIDARLIEVDAAKKTVSEDIKSEEDKLMSRFKNILKNATIAALTKSRETSTPSENLWKAKQEALKKSVHDKLVKFVVDQYRQGNRFQRRRNLRGAMRDILSNQGKEGHEAEEFDRDKDILNRFKYIRSQIYGLNADELTKFNQLYGNDETKKAMQDLVMKTVVELTVQRDAKWLKKKLSKDKAMEMTMMGSVLPTLVNTSIGEDRLRKAANKYKHLSGCSRLASMFEAAGAVHYKDLTFNDMLWILMLSGGGAALLA